MQTPEQPAEDLITKPRTSNYNRVQDFGAWLQGFVLPPLSKKHVFLDLALCMGPLSS